MNFWNGKVSTLKRDIDYQQTFAENLQKVNRKLEEELANMKRMLELQKKDNELVKKECGGMREDNERLNRMYLLVQKEAFSNVEKLKAEA